MHQNTNKVTAKVHGLSMKAVKWRMNLVLVSVNIEAITLKHFFVGAVINSHITSSV